ncbi:putative sucrose utilization protein SUC1 [Trichoderma lentiforme]|uniref:Sucrose utilization protein SUC1 n=1 Tax=Trichoderma lentiforme TaxID=1567552 RepID=A0A9P4X8Z0_9HYPO|nr:putative sucrose utilization protein SUC1 [Trichoderma lentiforme]
MTQAVKRACDACHRRKVKCDGINPCRNCSSAQLSCTYNAIPQKKGPKGSRAKVISELRETQRQTSLAAKIHGRINGGPNAPPASNLAPTPGMLTSELVKECSQFFFDHMNAQAPILDRRQVEQQILYMEQNRDAYCLMASMCAFVMLQPGMTIPSSDPYNLDVIPGANIVSCQLLLEETLRVRKGYEYLEQITINSLATNFFLFGCYYGQEMHEKAWYYLREATTMIQMVGMNKEEYYMQLDVAEAARMRRIYWLFFVIERAYAIQRQRPLTLQATINLPTLGDDPTDPLAHQLNGFILLVNLFRPFDDAFTSMWNKARSHLSSQSIVSLQKLLNDTVQRALCQDPSWNDVHTNQQWLKNMVWQLSNGVVAGGEDSISYQFPGTMSRELLLKMASHFPGQGMELLTSGLLEKLIECAYSMTEYLAMQPASRDPFAQGPHEHLAQIINIVSASRNGDYRFLPLLMSKVSEVLPRLVNPMLQNVPETIAMAQVDIFDGFGNAGMAQPAQIQMMETDYDRKFSVEEYEKKYVMEMNGGTPDSHSNSNQGQTPPVPRQASEMPSSFVGSPPMMSPTMEYPHNINGYAVTPMSEMVMSPIGNHPPPPQQHQHQAQHQHHQHQHINQPPPNHMHDPMGQSHMGMAAQNMQPLQPAHHMGNMMDMRQPGQRQNSFAMQGQPQHFHNMNAMTGEINFNTLR